MEIFSSVRSQEHPARQDTNNHIKSHLLEYMKIT